MALIVRHKLRGWYFFRSLLSTGLCAIFCLSACAPRAELAPTQTDVPVTPTTVASPTPIPTPQRAPLLRIAVFGDVTTTNVWALFDEAGADYWNYAPQSGYWPQLYRFSLHSPGLEPATAQGAPSSFRQEDQFYVASVTLQPGLRWTDSSELTAEDVAFTVNTALHFMLGLDWRSHYNPRVLERAEAFDRYTVRFFYKQAPGIADWQYGALQGPIVNQAYWQPRIADAGSRLPADALVTSLRELETQADEMQAQVDGLNLALNGMAPGSPAYNDASSQATNIQNDLISVYNSLDKVRTEYENKLLEARSALFELDNTGEPALGAWEFSGWETNGYKNDAVLGNPFGDPWFDSVGYITFRDESVAIDALLDDQVDVILRPGGLSAEAIARLEVQTEVSVTRNLNHSTRFLAINHANPYLADPVLHQALACLIDPNVLSAEILGEQAAPLDSFVLDDFWRADQASLPCAGMRQESRLDEAVRLLKSVGYRWYKEPLWNQASNSAQTGEGFRLPGNIVFPPVELLSLSSEYDELRASAAAYTARQFGLLGISLRVELTDPDNLFYAVYGSGEYDMAILGWRLSAYPAYLCDWFAPSGQNPFSYDGGRSELGEYVSLASVCESWAATADLEQAQAYASEVQEILVQDLPLIPLYTGVIYDAYRNVTYPFDTVVGGLSGLYGAPALAIPKLR